MPPTPKKICIGIDPGYAITGIGIIEKIGNKLTPLFYDAITTPKDMPFSKRVHHVYTELCKILTHYQPNEMAIEELFFSKNTKTALLVAQARGSLLIAAEEHGIPCYHYKPVEVKTAVSGYGRADKNQVQQMTKTLLKLRSIPKPDDVADALAVAICHCQSFRIHS